MYNLNVCTSWVPWNVFFFFFFLILPLNFLWWVSIIHPQQSAIAYLICFFYNFYIHRNVWEILLQHTYKKGFTMWLPPPTFTAMNNTASVYYTCPPATACSNLVAPCHPSAPWERLAPAAYKKWYFGLISFCGALSKRVTQTHTSLCLLNFMNLLFSSAR